MKKVWMLSLIVALLGIVGCQNNESSEQGGESSSNEKVEIKLWLDDDDYANALIPKIEEALPHIKIVHENVASGEISDKLELDGPAGLGGDIVFQTQESMAKAFQSNILLPLGESLTTYVTDNCLEGAIHSVVSNDVYYGVPLSVESLVLFYNKSLLEENNLEVVTSFEQLMDDAKTYNDFKSNKFLLRFEPWNTYTAFLFLSAYGYELFGPEGDNPDLINLDTEAVLKGLTTFKEIQQYLPIPSKELSWDTVHGEFVKGEVPYMINGPWAIAEVKEAAQTNDFEWGITTLPTIEGESPRPFLGNIVASISAYTEHREEAREVLAYISSLEGLEIMYDVTGKLPALKDNSVIEGVLDDPYITKVNEQCQIAQPMPMLGELNYFYQVGDIMFQSVWDGLLTPEEAVEKAINDYHSALEMMN